VEIDWVALGAILAGVGSMLTGVATYRVARKNRNGSETRSDDHDREPAGGG
jgi:hypothetical protein